MQLVEDEVLAADPCPTAVGPREPIRPHDGRRPVDPLGLPERAGVGPLGTVVEPEGVSLTLGYVRSPVSVIAARLRPHRDRAPCRAVDQDQVHPPRSERPDPKEDRPVRRSHRAAPRAGPTRLVSLITTALRLVRFRGLRPISLPARFRLAADSWDSRPRPSGSQSSGERLPARRVLILVTPRIALVGCEAPGSHRVLREVPHVARPRAGGMAASRAEDGVPQATPAQHALACSGRIWIFHGKSALLRRPAKHPRAWNRAPLSGLRSVPPIGLPDCCFLSFDLRSLSRSAADWLRTPVLAPGRRG